MKGCEMVKELQTLWSRQLGLHRFSWAGQGLIIYVVSHRVMPQFLARLIQEQDSDKNLA